MTALVTLLVVLLLSLIVTRVATVALTLTGLSRQSARFQARSAFTGAGFTTTESEMVVRHPVRRNIVMLLMLLGNAGIVAAVGSLLLTFIETGAPPNWGLRIAVLGGGIAVLWFLATSPFVDRLISRATTAALGRWTSLDVADYADLLHIGGTYKVIELMVEETDWLAGQTLDELNLRQEGILTLGIERGDGTLLGVPPLDTRVTAGDRMTLYGRADALADLDQRRAERGDAARRQAEEREQDRVATEVERDRGHNG